MSEQELIDLMKKIDPLTVRIPPGIKALADAICAWQRETDAGIVRNHSDSGFMFADAILDQGNKE